VFDVDSLATVAFDVEFFTGEAPLVLLVASSPLPRNLVDRVCLLIAEDLKRKPEPDWVDLASDCRWLLVQVLRGRIRAVEDSVRAALADDAASDGDYVALREYPNRLAKVESLYRDVPDPEWESHRPRSLYSIPALSTPVIANPGEEARAAAARLSGPA
jgi:hypothetical protein